MPDQVPEEVRLARQETLMKVQAEVSAEKMSGLVGQVLPILVDGVSEEHEWVKVGRLATQAPGVDGVVYLEEAGDDVLAGQMRMVEIQRSSVYDVVGRIVSSEVSP